MTDLEMIGYDNVRPNLERLSWASVDIHLSRRLDVFDGQAAKTLNVQEDFIAGLDRVTIYVPVENFKDNMLAFSSMLSDISSQAANLRGLHQSALDRINAQAAEIKWT